MYIVLLKQKTVTWKGSCVSLLMLADQLPNNEQLSIILSTTAIIIGTAFLLHMTSPNRGIQGCKFMTSHMTNDQDCI